jgi:hypothetical protein
LHESGERVPGTRRSHARRMHMQGAMDALIVRRAQPQGSLGRGLRRRRVSEVASMRRGWKDCSVAPGEKRRGR